MEENKTLQEWKKLVERYQRGEATDNDIPLFLAGAQVMQHVVYQAHVAADAEWRLHMMQMHERLIELERRQAEALERIMRVMEGEYDD